MIGPFVLLGLFLLAVWGWRRVLRSKTIRIRSPEWAPGIWVSGSLQKEIDAERLRQAAREGLSIEDLERKEGKRNRAFAGLKPATVPVLPPLDEAVKEALTLEAPPAPEYEPNREYRIQLHAGHFRSGGAVGLEEPKPKPTGASMACREDEPS